MIRNWTIPVFPISGIDLIKRGITPGPELGDQLRKLKEKWSKSYWSYSKEVLLNNIPLTTVYLTETQLSSLLDKHSYDVTNQDLRELVNIEYGLNFLRFDANNFKYKFEITNSKKATLTFLKLNSP